MHEHTLQELINRREITDVLIEYCCALDHMDLPRLSALFTDDCVVDYGPDERLRSRGALALEKSLERMWRSKSLSSECGAGHVPHTISRMYKWSSVATTKRWFVVMCMPGMNEAMVLLRPFLVNITTGLSARTEAGESANDVC